VIYRLSGRVHAKPMKPGAENASNRILFFLLGVDILFIVLHLVHIWTPYLPHAGFYIEADRSYPELFQYAKEFWLLLMFCSLSVIRSERVYLAWAFLFGFLLLDDAFVLHERLGFVAAGYFGHSNLSIGETVLLRRQDFGELIIYTVAGIALLTLIQTALRWGSDEFRQVSHRLVTLLSLFVLFGVVADVIHVALRRLPTLYRLVGTLEDGGEMVMLSVICWYVLRFIRQARTLPSANRQDR
jgi:hypothetical protein